MYIIATFELPLKTAVRTGAYTARWLFYRERKVEFTRGQNTEF